METKSDSSKTLLSDEESAQLLGLKNHLKQNEIKTLIEYYKRKDPDNKGLLPHQFKEAAGEFIASGLTIDPQIVFNIFDSAESVVDGRVNIREFVLGYAILSRGTTESRLRYLFSLCVGNRNSGNENDVLNDFLTREELIQCLKFLRRIVYEVSDSNSDEEASSEAVEENIQNVADNLIAESEEPLSQTISYNNFIDKLEETDFVVSWLDKLSNIAGEHLKYIEKLERDVAELNMEREGILNGSISRTPSCAKNMDWIPAAMSPKSPRLISKSDSTTRLSTSPVEKKRKIPMPRKQKIVRRDRLRRSPSDIDNNKHLQNRKKQQQQLQIQKHQLQQQFQKEKEQKQLKQQYLHSTEQNYEVEDVEEINAAAPFLINYEQITFGKILGRGACATVYEATWLHIPVAVKVFNDGSGEAANIERLATIDEEKRKAIVGDYAEEFWLLLQIRHPNCLLYMGICFEPYVCIVTELFTGGSVANYLHGQHVQRFSPSKAIEMISGVARGMYYLHASTPPILHRDLKASNILINRHATHCVICDFGLSKQFVNEASGLHGRSRHDDDSSNGSHSSREREGSSRGGRSNGRSEPGLIGTPYTMAPEIIEQKDYTPAADVYSFAIVMYEMYIGRYPFPKMKPIQLMFHVAKGRRPTFEEDDNIPPILRDLIERCWAQDPQKRPTFETILEVLHSSEFEQEVKAAEKKWNETQPTDDKQSNEPKELSKQLPDAAYHGRNEQLLRLINRGADVNYHDYDKRTALHVAAAEGHMKCMRILISAGATLTTDRWNNTPIVDAMNYAKRTKNSEPVRLLRAIESRSSNSANVDGIIEKRYMEQDELFRTYAALSAAQTGDPQSLKRLLDNGFEVNTSDYDGRTALMVAASDGKSDVVNMLLGHGANVRSRDRWGNTAYHEAERGGHHDIMRSIQQADERSGAPSLRRSSKNQW